jgi:UDP-N-acetylmuramate dehydrogenase
VTTASGFASAIDRALGVGRLRASEPLAPMTTFHVGGTADWFVDVRSEAELVAVIEAARDAKIPVTCLGGGSNVLVSDAGVRGVVIKLLVTEIAETDEAGGSVRAGAGVTINGLVRWMVSRGRAGLEAWAGTPGTVGGAIWGNAHYGGVNISERVRRVRVVTRDGRAGIVPAAEMGFAYDTSRLRESGEVVVWAEFEAGRGEPDALRATARASLAHRKRTQPLAQPSAGCVFQNPDRARDAVPADVPASAGALIDRAGLKGHRLGGARISPVHANFVVNEGGATAADIRAIMTAAREAVRERFGVDLRDEVVLLGEF